MAATTPELFRLEFNEPLNRELSTATLNDSQNGRRIDASVVVDSRSITLKPEIPLIRGSYRIDWRAVSTFDGHPVQGSFAVGVRRPPIAPSAAERGPLAGYGAVRITIRAVFYGSVLIFVGGMLIAALWTPRRREDDRPTAKPPTGLTGQPALVAGRTAVVSGVFLLLADTANAGGSLSPSVLEAYTFDTDAGRARLLAVVALGLSLVSMLRRRRSPAIGFAIAATAAIAFSGHANSADPRVVALITDWIHLLAGSIWIGGLFYLALTFVRRKEGHDPGTSQNDVGLYDRFGELILPAFLATVVTGLYNTAIELGTLSALWQTSYGVVLAVKLVSVLALLLVALLHSRLRRGVKDARPSGASRTRAFRRLVAGEPLLAIGTIVAAATLAVFPTPPRQAPPLIPQSERTGCNSCLAPATDQASLATQAGSILVVLSIRNSREGASGTLRFLDRSGQSVNRRLSLRNGVLGSPCGTGCIRFKMNARRGGLKGALVDGADSFAFRFPAVTKTRSSPRATAFVADAQAAMQGLRTFRADERIAVDQTVATRTAFESQAPDRLSFSAGSGAAGVVIDRQRWNRASAGAGWVGPETGSEAYRTRDAFTWKKYAERAWLVRDQKSEPVLWIALMDPDEPVWYELLVERGSNRVLKERMRTPGHFMTTKYFDFDAEIGVEPPDS